jgi:hypothetical protein
MRVSPPLHAVKCNGSPLFLLSSPSREQLGYGYQRTCYSLKIPADGPSLVRRTPTGRSGPVELNTIANRWFRLSNLQSWAARAIRQRNHGYVERSRKNYSQLTPTDKNLFLSMLCLFGLGSAPVVFSGAAVAFQSGHFNCGRNSALPTRDLSTVQFGGTARSSTTRPLQPD